MIHGQKRSSRVIPGQIVFSIIRGTSVRRFVRKSFARNKLTLSQTSPGFYVSAAVFWKTLREKEKLLETSNFSFSHSVFYLFDKLSAIFIKVETSSANSFSVEESEICRLGKGKVRLRSTILSNVCLYSVVETCLKKEMIQNKPNSDSTINSDTTQTRILTTRTTKKPFENIVGKAQKAGNQHFLLFRDVFCPSQTNINL